MCYAIIIMYVFAIWWCVIVWLCVIVLPTHVIKLPTYAPTHSSATERSLQQVGLINESVFLQMDFLLKFWSFRGHGLSSFVCSLDLQSVHLRTEFFKGMSNLDFSESCLHSHCALWALIWALAMRMNWITWERFLLRMKPCSHGVPV